MSEISPERQIAANQVGAVFNSLHDYLRALQPTPDTMTKQLEFAHARVDEAAMWAIKSVLMFGTPAPTAPAEAPAAPAAPAEAAT